VNHGRRPPLLVIKALVVMFAAFAVLLIFVFVMIREGVRNQVQRTVAMNLDVRQGILRAMEEGRLHELRTQAETLAENPTLKAAVDTYAAETSLAGSDTLQELLATVQRELDKLAERVNTDAVSLEDINGQTLAVAGHMQGLWSTRRAHSPGFHDEALVDGGLLDTGGMLFRVVRVPLTLEDGATVGWLDLGSALDAGYAESLDRIARARTTIVHKGAVIAGTLTPEQSEDFRQQLELHPSGAGTVELAGQVYAFRQIAHVESARIYALSSVDDNVSEVMARFNLVLIIIGGGAFALALAGSIWLARLLTDPIARLSKALDARASARDLTQPLPFTRSSREVDSLTETFNQLMASVAAAEANTEAAYAGAIRALAATLDARDPYTAGHSERVSVLSVEVGRTLGLPESDIEVLRFGALLHDIGKIGIPDDVLRKPGRLTDEEFATIMEHPSLGARILSTIPFLQPHLPIVELHHERPDGLGYPKGLRGDEIPLLARIVHVTDAYDAITSARAYRQGRSSAEALRELWRCAGTEFHPEIVGALARALPKVVMPMEQPRRGAHVVGLQEIRSA
jgi:putative nucleotidyltransferase with HDIG domain